MVKGNQESNPGTQAPPSGPGHHRIVSMEIIGAGFLDGVKLEFVDGLNTIIGGRGTGKTTMLQLARHDLGLEPDARANPKQAKARQALIESNLKHGRIRLTIETKHGIRYVIERPANDTAQVFNAKGEATSISFQNDNIFGVDFYGTNEIEQIALDPSRQLALIDRPIEEDVRRIEGEIRTVERDLTQSATDLLRLNGEVRDLAETASEATVIEERLKPLRQVAGPDAKAQNLAHARRALRDRERAALEGLGSDLLRVERDLDTTVGGIRRRLDSRVDADLADGPNEDLLTKVRDEVLEVTRALERAVVKVKEQSLTANTALEKHKKTLADRHAKEEADYRVLLAKSQEETGRATERQRLEQRHLEVASARKELVQRKAELRRAEEHRQELLAHLTSLRDDRYHRRVRVAENLTEALKPNIRVSVTQNGGSEAYYALLHEGLQGGKVKYEAMINRIIEAANPDEFCNLIQYGDAKALAEVVNTDTDKAQTMINSLKDTEQVFRIETVEQEDVPHIELLDGQTYKDSASISTGQCSTAILPILLLESERPLIIDQPEDDLDNAFIYETVVKTLNRIKRKRQLIFVTHNPNIPVLGDADRVFVMESDGQRARLHKAGTVDDCKEEIERLLEGGIEAFLLRKKRYGH